MNVSLYLEGENIGLSSVKAEELGCFLTAFTDLLKKAEPGDAEVSAYLTGLHDNCVRFDFQLDRNSLKRYAMIAAFVVNHCVLPAACGGPLRDLNGILRRTGASLRMRGVRKSEVTFSEETPLPLPTSDEITFETTIYGELEWVGGVNPKAHIRPLGSKHSITCSVSKDLAKDLGTRLYTVVGLKGSAQQKDGEIAGLSVAEVMPYVADSHSNPFEALRKAGASEYFDGVDAYRYVEEARG